MAKSETFENLTWEGSCIGPVTVPPETEAALAIAVEDPSDGPPEYGCISWGKPVGDAIISSAQDEFEKINIWKSIYTTNSTLTISSNLFCSG